MNQGYLDIHTHVLPGVDDGSKDLEMTRVMLQKCYDQGVRTIVATSHNYPGEKKQDNEERIALTKEVDAIAKSIDPEFCVLPGNEIYYRADILKDIEEGHALTMNQSDYVLVEFNPSERFSTVRQGLAELIEHGYYPIVAHVERVDTLFEDAGHLEEVLRMGVYLQANTEDFMGAEGRKCAKKLRKMFANGQIHFLGSDCHRPDKRPPLMKDCVDYLTKKLGEQTVEAVTVTNRDRFLSNKYLK